MEEDSRSDSGVSTLRSDGARSSGDERSGSRSSAVSDERAGSQSAEPDIKIVGTVERSLSSQFYKSHHGPGMTDRHNIALPPNSLSGNSKVTTSPHVMLLLGQLSYAIKTQENWPLQHLPLCSRLTELCCRSAPRPLPLPLPPVSPLPTPARSPAVPGSLGRCSPPVLPAESVRPTSRGRCRPRDQPGVFASSAEAGRTAELSGPRTSPPRHRPPAGEGEADCSGERQSAQVRLPTLILGSDWLGSCCCYASSLKPQCS